jgi:ATP-dependent Lon protease
MSFIPFLHTAQEAVCRCLCHRAGERSRPLLNAIAYAAEIIPRGKIIEIKGIKEKTLAVCPRMK